MTFDQVTRYGPQDIFRLNVSGWKPNPLHLMKCCTPWRNGIGIRRLIEEGARLIGWESKLTGRDKLLMEPWGLWQGFSPLEGENTTGGGREGWKREEKWNGMERKGREIVRDGEKTQKEERRNRTGKSKVTRLSVSVKVEAAFQSSRSRTQLSYNEPLSHPFQSPSFEPPMPVHFRRKGRIVSFPRNWKAYDIRTLISFCSVSIHVFPLVPISSSRKLSS